MCTDWDILLRLSLQQAYSLHVKVLAFLKQRMAELLDCGLMDDVLFMEYENNVKKLDKGASIECVVARDTAISNLAVLFISMLKCAQESIEQDTPYPLFYDFLAYATKNMEDLNGLSN